MKTFSLLLLIFLTACGKSDDSTPGSQYNIDSRYRPIYESFIAEARSRGHDYAHIFVSIEVTNIDVGGNGPVICYPSGTIRINGYEVESFVRDENSPTYREWILFHALGHCILNRSESSSGIMKLNNYSRDYDLNRGNYLNELFGTHENAQTPSNGIN